MCECVRVYAIHTRKHTYMNIHFFSCVCVSICVWKYCMCAYIYICIQIRAYKHIYIHSYMQTYKQKCMHA